MEQGVIRCNPDLKYKTKGPTPSDQDQALWAPLSYFTYTIAGNVIALMNKMGVFKLSINYGVNSVADYLSKYINTTIVSFIDSEDQTNASR